MQFEIYDSVKTHLVDERPTDFASCVKWARLQFQESYYNTIAQLLYNFPADQVREHTLVVDSFFLLLRLCKQDLVDKVSFKFMNGCRGYDY
mgnify:CR=1 FL=1